MDVTTYLTENCLFDLNITIEVYSDFTELISENPQKQNRGYIIASFQLDGSKHYFFVDMIASYPKLKDSPCFTFLCPRCFGEVYSRRLPHKENEFTFAHMPNNKDNKKCELYTETFSDKSVYDKKIMSHEVRKKNYNMLGLTSPVKIGSITETKLLNHKAQIVPSHPITVEFSLNDVVNLQKFLTEFYFAVLSNDCQTALIFQTSHINTNKNLFKSIMVDEISLVDLKRLTIATGSIDPNKLFSYEKVGQRLPIGQKIRLNKVIADCLLKNDPSDDPLLERIYTAVQRVYNFTPSKIKNIDLYKIKDRVEAYQRSLDQSVLKSYARIANQK